MNLNPVCKLCQENPNLCESHIISEAFFEEIYDKKHRALPISMASNELKLIQKGIRENLLCVDCERKLSKWEAILKRDLVDFGNQKSKFLKISQIDKELFKVEGIRYKEFKLAILSIVWRMSITSEPFFNSYKLGVYEGKLRRVLLDENVPDEKKYPIMISRYEIDGVFYPGIVGGFLPSKFFSMFTTQSFIIWGHYFMVFINDKIFPKLPIEFFLRNSGELYVDSRSYVELVSPTNVFSKIYDEDVRRMYEKME